MTKEQQAALDLLYNTYSPLGYDMASIAGIAGNGLVESGLNPDSVSASKTYHGAWLNHKNIRKAIESMYGDYSMNSLMKFIDDWNNRADNIMKGNYSAYTSTNAGKYKKGGYKTARDAADAFMRYYERPVIMKDGKVVGYQKANERYANAEAAYKYLYDKYGSPEITEYNLPDGGKRMIFKPRQVDVQLSDAVAVQKPTVITPVKRAQPVAEVQRTLPETVITGRRIQPLSSLFSAELPSLDDVFDLGGPEDLFKSYVADALGVPNMHLKMPSFKKGKAVIGSNVDMNDDGTFTDDYTRVFDNLIVTPQGPRIKPGQLHKYQEPWDDEKFINAVTMGGLNNLSPSLWVRRGYDLFNGNLTADSWLNGNNGIVSNKFAQDHPHYSTLFNAVGDGLIGASAVLSARVLNQLRPQNLGKHFYYNVNPQGYNNIIKLAKGIAKTVLKGSEPDIENPIWDIPGAFKEGALEYGVPEDVFRKARIDAWRMHTNLPQKYNTFTPSKRVPGAYTAERDVARMMEPDILEDDKIIRMLNKDKGGGIDFFNGSGGNVGFVNYDLGRTLNGDKLGVLVTDDIWDILPFSRIDQGQGLGSRLTKHTTEKILKKVLPIKNKVVDKLDNLSYNDDIEGYKKWAAQHPDEAEYIDPRDIFSTPRKIKPALDLAIKTINKGTTKMSDFDRWLRKTLNNKAKNFEVGSLYKGSPFRVVNEFPYTRALNVNNLGQMNPGAIYSYWGGFDTKNILPTLAHDYHLKGILPVNIGDNIPSQLRYK